MERLSTKFVNYILPRKTSELTFIEAVELLMELFSSKTSLFHKRWKCLNLTRKEWEDYTTFASIVNKHCDDFRLAELSANNFKCLIFVQELVSTKDAEIRRRILNKLENEPNITLQQIAEECQRNVSLKRDSKNIKESGTAHIKKVRSKQKQSLLKLMKQRKSQISCPLTHAMDVGPYIGTKIVCSRIKNITFVTKSNTKVCIAYLKIKPIAA